MAQKGHVRDVASLTERSTAETVSRPDNVHVERGLRPKEGSCAEASTLDRYPPAMRPRPQPWVHLEDRACAHEYEYRVPRHRPKDLAPHSNAATAFVMSGRAPRNMTSSSSVTPKRARTRAFMTSASVSTSAAVA